MSQDVDGCHPDGVDIGSHLDVFYSILKQVSDTPQEIPFLHILQHLLRVDPKEAVSDLIWDTAERLVHKATLLENKSDSTRLLRDPQSQHKSLHRLKSVDGSSGLRKQSMEGSGSENTCSKCKAVGSEVSGAPPPPPPPPSPVSR